MPEEEVRKIVDEFIEKVEGATVQFQQDARNMFLDALRNKELSEATRNQLLNQVRDRAVSVDEKLRRYVKQSVLSSYAVGAKKVDEALKSADVTIDAIDWQVKTFEEAPETVGAIHRESVNAILSESYLDFGDGLNEAVSNVDKAFSNALKKDIRDEILQARVRGESIPKIARKIEGFLGDRGFSALVDRGGKRWSLRGYSNMLTRTHIIRANGEATKNRMIQTGNDIVRCSSHGAVDAICSFMEGRIFSISGQSENYPPIPIEIPFHPNCQHTWIPEPLLE